MTLRLDVSQKQETKLWTGQEESRYEKPVDGYDLLCEEVVRKAVCDYARALRRHRLFPGDSQALHTISECETFFRKGMSLYSDMDGEKIIKAAQDRVQKEKPRKIKKKNGRGRPKKDENY